MNYLIKRWRKLSENKKMIHNTPQVMQMILMLEEQDKRIEELEDNSYLKLSEEAKETLKGMVEFCINKAYCMGMDEGYQGDTKRPFRIELEDFVKGGTE